MFDETIECEVCHETISMREVEMGQVAEMFDPKEPRIGGIVHPDCGFSKGWEVA